MLIRESTLRRIIREEVQRATSEDTVNINLIKRAMQADQTAAGPLGAYIANYENAFKQIEKSAKSLPEDSKARGVLLTSFASFTKRGSQSPFAPRIIRVQGLANISPQGKARAILAILAGDQNPGTSWDKVGGVTLGIDMQSGPTRTVDESFDNPEQFVQQVVAMASFDVVGETKKALAPAATMEMEPSSYPGPAPAAPKAAAAPPRDWPSYVRAVQRGSEIQQLWNGYADKKGVSRDYSAYVTWWKSKKKANPSWKGHATDVVTSLRQEIIGAPAALDSSADLSQSFGAIQQRKAAGQ